MVAVDWVVSRFETTGTPDVGGRCAPGLMAAVGIWGDSPGVVRVAWSRAAQPGTSAPAVPIVPF